MYKHNLVMFVQAASGCFLSPVALQMLSSVLNLIDGNGMQENYTFEEIMAYLKMVRVNQVGGKCHTSCVTKKVAKVCNELGINLDNPSSLMAL